MLRRHGVSNIEEDGGGESTHMSPTDILGKQICVGATGIFANNVIDNSFTTYYKILDFEFVREAMNHTS